MTKPFVDPDLQPILDNAPSRPPLSVETLADYRATKLVADPSLHFPGWHQPVGHRIDGPGGPLDIYEFAPESKEPDGPALLWLHGGGYILGDGAEPWFGTLFAERATVTVFSVNYRLAPEHPFPAARDDAWAGLNWVAQNSARLGVDANRLAIGGDSAGGGLAAALAIHNRDMGGPPVAFQLLLYPMLDNRHDTPSGHMEVPRWPREASLAAWAMYLGGTEPQPTSVPAVATDLQGLPPAFLTIGEADLFLDDTRKYTDRLREAGVAAELRTYPGVFHAAENQGYGTRIGRQMTDEYVNALASALRRQ